MAFAEHLLVFHLSLQIKCEISVEIHDGISTNKYDMLNLIDVVFYLLFKNK